MIDKNIKRGYDMKKMIGMLLAAVLVLSLAGCGDSGASEESDSTAAVRSSAAESSQAEVPEKKQSMPPILM